MILYLYSNFCSFVGFWWFGLFFFDMLMIFLGLVGPMKKQLKPA